MGVGTSHVGHAKVYPKNKDLLRAILVKLQTIIKLLTPDKEPETDLHGTTTDSPDSFTYNSFTPNKK